ncbi:unnamed protein product [Victoria cruziana]
MDADRLICLLEKLETDGIRRDFAVFFQPLLQCQAKKKSRTTAKRAGPAVEDRQIHALAKQFLPTLSRLLKLCPNLLSSPSTDVDARSRALVIFEIFEMTLDCFDCVSRYLDGKPFQIDLQRYRLVRRLEAWKFHDTAKEQCFLILGRLRYRVFSCEIEPIEEDTPSLLPDKAATCDPELALLVVETVASIVRCTFKSKCSEIKEYEKILTLIEQVWPWLSIIDQKIFEKFHGILIEAVYNCAIFVVSEALFLQGDIVSRLCIHAIAMCLRSGSKDMLTTHDMILFSNQILDIVNFSVKSLRGATRSVKNDAALLLYNASRSSLKVVLPSLTAIINVYAAGLFILVSDVLGNQEACTSGSLLSASTYSEECENCLHTLSMSINLIRSDIVGGAPDETSKVHPRSSDLCTLTHGRLSLTSYMNGLAFFCKPFAELAKTRWKHISVNKVLSSGSINHILNVLYLFCDAVVMVFEEFKDNSLFEDAPTLYSALRYSCTNLSHQKLGIISEEEILAYAELYPSNPSFCRAMQERITNVLLTDVYVNSDSYFQRARAFISKGRIASMCGVEDLKCSLDSLHEAISILNHNLGEAHANGNASALHLLALTHCLRAVCASEADKQVEVVLQDICSALQLWSSMKALGMSLSNIQLGLVIANELPLLCHIADLLALKGLWNLHSEILVVIVILSKLKEIPEEEILVFLCRYRRLHHTFCLSPFDKELLLKLQQQFGVSYCSVNFWISRMKEDALSLHGFHQEFILSCFISQQEYPSTWKGSAPAPFRSTEKLKASVSALTSNECRDSHSTFMAAYLCYDLCDQLSSCGQLNEALLYSRKALQLRRKLLQRFFPFSIEKKTINGGSYEGNIDNKTCHVHIEAHGAAMKSVWADMSKCGNGRSSCFNHWSLLKCFLESSLQIGIIHDLIGNGDDAEDFFQIGKKISYLQGLTFFEALFSSWLGHIYRRRQLWDLSEKEILYGKGVLMDCIDAGFCKLCKLTLESTLEMKHADLMRSRFQWATEGTLAQALKHYMLAKEHLKTIGSEVISCKERSSRSCCKGNCVACFGDWSKTDTCICATVNTQGLCGMCATRNNHLACPRSEPNQSKIETSGDVIEGGRLQPNGGSKRSRSRKAGSIKNLVSDSAILDTAKQKLPTGKHLGAGRNCRNDPSTMPVKHQVGEDTSQLQSSEKKILAKASVCRRMSSCQEENADFSLKFVSDRSRLQTFSDCWRCFNLEVTQTGCMVSLILLKLENHRRNLFLKLLIQMGKCRRMLMETQEAHDIFSQSVCLLFYRDASLEVHSGILNHLVDYVREGNKDDLLSVDHASLLYQISWFYLDHRLSDQLKMCSCGLQNVPLETIVSLLLHAFIICREVPLHFQKVSRLLAVIHLISMPGGSFPLPVDTSSCLSLIHWAAYFHQASIGSYVHHQNFVALNKKQEQVVSSNLEVYASLSGVLFFLFVISSLCIARLWVAPNNINDLEGFVLGFFQHLPSTSILCISLIGGDCANFLSEMSLLPCAHVPAWIFLSRLTKNQQPVSFLLPVDVICQGTGQVNADSMVPIAYSSRNSNKLWVCPWGRSILDEVAPGLRKILEGNSLSGSSHFLADTGHNRSVWWKWRTLLNQHLDDLLRNVEESWFGPWKCLLPGDLVHSSSLDKVLKKLTDNLRSCNFEVNESLLRIILSSASFVADLGACVSQLLSHGGWLGFGDCCGRTKGRVLFPSSGSDEEETFDVDASSQLILDALSELGQPEAPREPFILVLDIDVQMLPWESLPVLRNQEVYRMPSVGSVLSTLDRWKRNSEEWARKVIDDGGNFPCINLLDTFYLLNPGGDLTSTQAEFEDWFRSQNWEGKINIPSEEELAWALQKHDLFLYFGHGSGEQYLSRHKIEMLNRCAATLLMGCSSGCLSYKGSYLPKGVPLSYLIAGCPTVIANLWDVTDKDIDKFSKVLLKDWLEHVSMTSDLEERFQNLQVASSTKFRKKTPRCSKKATDAQQVNHKFQISDGEGTLRVASSMGKARDACRLPFLVGASSVCYGVPTFLSKKE